MDDKPSFTSALHALLGGPSPLLGATRPPLQMDVTGGSGPGPLAAFTSSKVPFEKFDQKFIGTGIGHNYNGYGFYLTGSKNYATAVRDSYHPGGVVQQAKINVPNDKLFNLDAKKVDPSLASKIERFIGEPLDRFATARDALYQLESVPVTAYRALFKDPTISTSQQGASKFLSASGYKGNAYSDSYGKHYVIYDPKDLEVVGAE